tara:strand:+ start:19 stop:1386 length:1368 start_codon:yes stop_codon:yes gene_type:complete
MALTQISTAGVKDDAVTSGKIPANAVGSSELADNAVDRAAIADDAVNADKITAGGVDTNALGSDSVTTVKILNANVTTAKIADNAVTSAKLGTSAVTTGKINDDAVTSAKIADTTIVAGNIASSAITTSKIADQAVTLEKLPHGTGSNDGKFLRANNGADPTFETVSIPAGTTLNDNTDSYVMTGTGTSNTLQGEANLQFDGTTLSLNKGGLTNAQKLVIQGSGNSTADNLTLNNWGNSDGDYWTLGVNMTANNGGSFAKTDTNLRCVGINIDGRMGRIIFNASETGTSTISDAHTFQRDGSHYMNGAVYLGGETSSNHSLDDYEEGTWTPAYSRPNMTLGLANQVGRYVKIGKVVHVVGKLNTTSENGSPTGGPIIVTGLPFTVRDTRTALSVRPSSWSNDHPSFATFELNQTHFELLEEVEGNPSGSSDLGGSRFAGGTGNFLWFGGTYFTDT